MSSRLEYVKDNIKRYEEHLKKFNLTREELHPDAQRNLREYEEELEGGVNE